jgi:transposase-like protein
MSSRGKFTPERAALILEALKINPSVPSAASRAGIHANTLRNWLAEGESGNPTYTEFALEAQEARMTMKDSIVAALLETALDPMHPQQTKAAHQLLTNLFPREFSSVKHVVSHQAKSEDVDLSKLPAEELRVFRKTLLKLQSGPDQDLKEAAPVIDIVNGNG